MIAVTAVVVVALVVRFFVGQNPEDASNAGRGGRRGRSREMFGAVNDRPGSPGAEAQGVAGPGQIVPGPSAEASDEHVPSMDDPSS
ncbi:MAG: hypothetical protein HZB15_16890 [Actinobacteria bacterium]|nr:hypothetical protein [Actinomycetota bacterium]